MVTEGTPVSKGSLNDFLQAIDIGESPLVRADLIEACKYKTKKSKTSKKLKFYDQASEIFFKPRRLVRRYSKEIQEALLEASETGR